MSESLINMKLNLNIIKKTLKKHPVEMAFLFGSHSRGAANKLSDIDIAVLFNEEASLPRAENRLLGDLAAALKTDNIDLVNIREASPLLAHRAVLRGKPLLKHNPHREANLKVAVLNRYEDTKPLRRIAEQALNFHS